MSNSKGKMKVRKATNVIDDIEELKLLALKWKEECKGEGFGIELVPQIHYSDLAGLIEKDDADLLLLMKRNKVVGYMGIFSFDSPLGNQRIAEEHYWFVSDNKRGHGTMLLIRAARQWAKQHGCSHIIFNASCLASDMHDRLCRFYEKIGFRKFETSYIKEL